MKRSASILLYLTIVPLLAFAQVTDMLPADSVTFQERYKRSNEFFDGLQKRSQSSKISHFIVNSLIVDNDWTGKEARKASRKLVDESAYFSKFEGKEIVNIYIFPYNVFGDSATYTASRLINAIHVKTKYYVVQENLLFEVGDKVNAKTMILNEEHLRGLNYISDAYIIIQPHENSEDQVDVFIYSRDKWSINVDVDMPFSDIFRTKAYDNNFLGLGHEITLGTYLHISKPFFKGHIVGYQVDNIAGSFFSVRGLSQRIDNEYLHEVEVKKKFIKPSDYMAGMLFNYERKDENQLLTDTTLLVKRRLFDIWAGGALKLTYYRSSLFLTFRLSNLYYDEIGIKVTNNLNPYYRGGTTFLIAGGMFSESFYRGTNIYSFSVSEDIPYGYKAEFIGGYSCDEFADRYYFATKWSAGQGINIGYLRGSVEYGSFFTRDFIPEQTSLFVDLGYFTNLYDAGDGYLRYFLHLSYVAGFNRLTGEREQVTFRGQYELRTLDLPHIGGLNRFEINMEAVYFSPFYFYNFRFAPYAFCDMGWLGDDRNVFSNDFYTTTGMGLRIKNDRLIFASIQLQLGYTLVNPMHGKNKWIRLGSEHRISTPLFIPGPPTVVEYK
jgi:hypothetical protein